jgi:hypothetical protein
MDSTWRFSAHLQHLPILETHGVPHAHRSARR